MDDVVNKKREDKNMLIEENQFLILRKDIFL